MPNLSKAFMAAVDKSKKDNGVILLSESDAAALDSLPPLIDFETHEILTSKGVIGYIWGAVIVRENHWDGFHPVHRVKLLE